MPIATHTTAFAATAAAAYAPAASPPIWRLTRITSTFWSSATRNRPRTAGQAPPTRSRSRRAAAPTAGRPSRAREIHQSPNAVAASDSGVPKYAPVTPIPTPTSTNPKTSRPPASRTIDHATGLYRCAPCSAPRSTDRSSHSTPVGAAAAAAHSSGTEIRSAIGCRSSTAHAVTATPVSSSRFRQTASVAASCGPSPRRPSAISRATATCTAEPGTERITNVDTSAASEP